MCRAKVGGGVVGSREWQQWDRGDRQTAGLRRAAEGGGAAAKGSHKVESGEAAWRGGGERQMAAEECDGKAKGGGKGTDDYVSKVRHCRTKLSPLRKSARSRQQLHKNTRSNEVQFDKHVWLLLLPGDYLTTTSLAMMLWSLLFFGDATTIEPTTTVKDLFLVRWIRHCLAAILSEKNQNLEICRFLSDQSMPSIKSTLQCRNKPTHTRSLV